MRVAEASDAFAKLLLYSLKLISFILNFLL